MEKLDAIYLGILRRGLTTARDAALSGNLARCSAELEHLHNLPSLIGESNVHRHLYYIGAEKTRYLACVIEGNQKDWKEFVATAYLPLWKEIEEVLAVDEIIKRGKR